MPRRSTDRCVGGEPRIGDAAVVHFVANAFDARSRLDRILVRRITSVSRFSRSQAQQWIYDGAVSLDGALARRPSDRVHEGTYIEVRIPATATLRSRPAPEALPLRVLYEDPTVMVVDKDAGTVVHPSYKRPSGTLLNAVLAHIADRPPLQPGIVTRLDKDTSGLVLLAMSPAVHAALQRAASAGMVRKEYLAVVAGKPDPPAGRIELPLARDPADRRRMIAAPDGAPSVTRYECLATRRGTGGDESLVRCELVTGRTHQIRVHLSASGWPLIGDTVYGAPDGRIARQALHAWRLSFRHPSNGSLVEIASPLPADVASLWPDAGERLAASSRLQSSI